MQVYMEEHMTRRVWQIPDPNGVLQDGSPIRRMVKAYKELAGSDGLAEALAELVTAGYAQLMGSAGSPILSPMERPPAHRRAGVRMKDQTNSPERTGGPSAGKSRAHKPRV